MALHVPISLKSEHESLLARMRRAMRENDATGEAARRVMQVMDGHMMREEKFALRPLGILKALARGETPAELADVAQLVHDFKAELPQMVDEHRQIAELLRLLAREAETLGKHEYVELAEDLIEHAHLEEDVLYPAAMLLGKYAAFVRGGG